jgi:hypothetical protein
VAADQKYQNPRRTPAYHSSAKAGDIGGLSPLWSPDGQSVIYRTASGFVQAKVSFTPRFEVTARDPLFTASAMTSVLGRDHDADRRTGDFILRVRNLGTERIVVVTGWLDELRERMIAVGQR